MENTDLAKYPINALKKLYFISFGDFLFCSLILFTVHLHHKRESLLQNNIKTQILFTFFPLFQDE